MQYANSEDSDQPPDLCRLIRVFAVAKTCLEHHKLPGVIRKSNQTVQVCMQNCVSLACRVQ